MYGVYTLQKGKAIPFVQRIQFAIDVARGMSFLHSNNRVHRDLKSLNLLVNIVRFFFTLSSSFLLRTSTHCCFFVSCMQPHTHTHTHTHTTHNTPQVDKQPVVKVADFGESRTTEDNMTIAAGTYNWWIFHTSHLSLYPQHTHTHNLCLWSLLPCFYIMFSLCWDYWERELISWIHIFTTGWHPKYWPQEPIHRKQMYFLLASFCGNSLCVLFLKEIFSKSLYVFCFSHFLLHL
jgi:serine/threonine protein kinase